MRFDCILESVESLGATSYLVCMRPESGLVFAAGQYIKLDVTEEGGNRRLEGYFSIASPPESDRLELIIGTSERRQPTAADRLVRMQPGEKVSVEGPFGDFVFKQVANRHVCFISHGTGIAPLLSMLRSRAFMQSAPLSATFLTGYRNELEIIGMGAFGRSLPPLRYLVTLSQPRQDQWPGLKGRVTDHLRMGTLSIQWQQTEFYLCGSHEMVSEVKALLFSKGVDPSSVHVF